MGAPTWPPTPEDAARATADEYGEQARLVLSGTGLLADDEAEQALLAPFLFREPGRQLSDGRAVGTPLRDSRRSLEAWLRMMTGRPFEVTEDWSVQTVTASPDEDQWTCMGARHDRTDSYGRVELRTILANVSANIILVLFPLTIEPMGPIEGDRHILRPDKDYPVWRSQLPEGYVMLDEVRIEFADTR